MFIGYFKANIFIPHSRSLKDKRRVIRQIRDRVRSNFNVSMAEKPLDKWQLSELSFVYVNYTKKCVDDMIHKLEESMRFNYDIQILDTEREIL